MQSLSLKVKVSSLVLLTSVMLSPAALGGPAERNQALKFFRMGEQAIESGNLDLATKYFSSSVASDPTFRNAHLNLGLVLLNNGKPKEAIKELDIAIKIDPKESSAINNRAMAKAGLKDYVGALKDMDAAIALGPKTATRYSNRGAMKRVMGNLKGARDDMMLAAKLAPNDPSIQENLRVINSALKVDMDMTIRKTGDWSSYGKNGFVDKSKPAPAKTGK